MRFWGHFFFNIKFSSLTIFWWTSGKLTCSILIVFLQHFFLKKGGTRSTSTFPPHWEILAACPPPLQALGWPVDDWLASDDWSLRYRPGLSDEQTCQNAKCSQHLLFCWLGTSSSGHSFISCETYNNICCDVSNRLSSLWRTKFSSSGLNLRFLGLVQTSPPSVGEWENTSLDRYKSGEHVMGQKHNFEWRGVFKKQVLTHYIHSWSKSHLGVTEAPAFWGMT